MNVHVLGAATTKFGELWDVSPRTLARQAVEGALSDAGLSRGDIDALFVGNMLSGVLGRQEHLGAFFAEELGLPVSAMKVEGACASGGLAVHSAVLSILSGQYRRVVVLGVEKMTDHLPDDVASALMGAGSEEERMAGATFPGLYALLARAHMAAFGTTEEHLAAVAVKNHYHASLNPAAQFRSEITVADVLKSSRIADPLKLLDCSPISDGASALVLGAEAMRGRPAGGRKPAIEVVASCVSTDTLGVAGRGSLTGLAASTAASGRAYRNAGITPASVQVAEVHDCFTIAEILAMEDLGFFAKGQAADAIAAGATTLGRGGLVVNPSGGLKGCGHPVGATGVKQVVELVEQLRGTAGKRQVPDARIGLAHNVGGSGATAVVHILKTKKGDA